MGIFIRIGLDWIEWICYFSLMSGLAPQNVSTSALVWYLVL